MIPPTEFTSQIPLNSLVAFDRKGKETLIGMQDKVYANLKGVFQSQGNICDLLYSDGALFVLSEKEVAYISAGDYKLIKKISIDNYPIKLIGILSTKYLLV